MRISDWSSDVCSSDLLQAKWNDRLFSRISAGSTALEKPYGPDRRRLARSRVEYDHYRHGRCAGACRPLDSDDHPFESCPPHRSEEHTSELQSLMRISYAVFCLKKKKNKIYVENKYHQKKQ